MFHQVPHYSIMSTSRMKISIPKELQTWQDTGPKIAPPGTLYCSIDEQIFVKWKEQSSRTSGLLCRISGTIRAATEVTERLCKLRDGEQKPLTQDGLDFLALRLQNELDYPELREIISNMKADELHECGMGGRGGST